MQASRIVHTRSLRQGSSTGAAPGAARPFGAARPRLGAPLLAPSPPRPQMLTGLHGGGGAGGGGGGAPAPGEQQQQQQVRRQEQQQRQQPRTSPVAAHARYRGGGGGGSFGGGGGGGGPQLAERLLAAVPYLLPFLDALGYGRFLFYQYPVLTRLLAPIAPLISLYASVPLAPLVAFFGVYLGIVQNQRWSRFVRFNAMQAMLLDILLILPRLAEQVLSTPQGGPALQAYVMAQNAIWVFVAAAVAYGVGASLAGVAARIPLVADAAEQQVR